MNRTAAYILLILSFLSLNLVAQKKETLVYLEHSETLSFDEKRYPDAQLLRGNVRFRHEDVLMYCDSAFFYEGQNSLNAFGHVHFIQGDTLQAFGDVLYYDGNSKLAQLRHHVRLQHTNTTLYTDSLNYDRVKDMAWYFTGGTIRDSLNTLHSIWGQYTPYDKQAVFRDSVSLINEQFNLKSDKLRYNTETNIADIVSPTEIVYEEETTILSSRGWYNTRTEESMLLDRSQVIHNGGRTLTADTIFYNKQAGHGDARQRMEMTDSIQHITLYGNTGEVYEQPQHGYATDSALLIDWSSDQWTYMHADTLFSETINYQIKRSVADSASTDTMVIDSSLHLIRAYYGVRVYKEDMQMVCDSLRYNDHDSIMSLYGNPICWSDNQQISADSILIFMKDNAVDYAHGFGSAIAIQQDNDTSRFNQLSGKEIKAFVRDGELREIHVNGNAETVFFPHEDDGTLVGINKTQSSYVKIFLANQQIEHILFTAATTGAMYPVGELSESQTRLANFFWAENERPIVPGDVFSRPQRAERPSGKPLSASDTSQTENEEHDNKKKDKRNKRDSNNNFKKR